MKNTLIFKFGKIISFPYNELFNKLAISSIREREEFYISQVYLVSLSRKVFFDLSKTFLDDTIMIETELVCGSIKSKVRVSPLDILREEFSGFNSHMELWAYLYHTKSTIKLNRKKSSSTMLHFDFKVPDGECFKQVCVEVLIENFKLFPNETAEVLYIGKTERLITERIKEHKKIFDLIEESNPDHAIRLYFANIELLASGRHITSDCAIVKLLASIEKIDRKIKVGLAEKLLVHYYQPKYNSTYKNWKISDDDQIDYLRDKVIERIGLDVGVESNTLYQFKSPKQISTSDEVYLNFDKMEKGFIPKWDLDIKEEMKNYNPPNRTILCYKALA
jgi:hypothetical protein